MRALEVGRYAIRATNTGISAFIDPNGKVIKSGPQFKPATLTATVEPRKGMTPFASTGNKPVIGFCLLIIAAFWLRTRSS
jgi:apolipoprotein N-acyltransferase